MMLLLLVGFNVLLVGTIWAAIPKLPEYVYPCIYGDSANFHTNCMLKNMPEIVARAMKPIPELGVRQLDPLHIDTLNIDFGGERSQSVNVAAVLSNVSVYGLSQLKVLKSALDFDRLLFSYENLIPEVLLVGTYVANGKILLLPINSNGPFNASGRGVEITGFFHGERYMKKGATYIKPIFDKMDVNISDMSLYLNDLFPTNDELTINTNRVINENVEVLYSDVKPVIEGTMVAILSDIVKSVFAKFPLDVLFPKAPPSS